MKASSSGRSNLGHVCANLRRFWCILGTYPFPCWPLEASRGGMLEVSRAVGSRSGLC